jgi:glucosamine-6-phosphate deaminase
LQIRRFRSGAALGRAAAAEAAGEIRAAIESHGRARIIAATGASQFDFLRALVGTPDIDWANVELFHLDEYVGLSESHPASFRRYLRERLIGPTGIRHFHFLDGEADPQQVMEDVGGKLRERPVDVAFVGIGENAHLAFNDPPADFETDRPYLLVELDAACRRQQVGEGWFPDVESVPSKAISMSCRQILASRRILCIVPDARKSAAVKATIEGAIVPETPASILRRHSNVTLFLDEGSSSALASPPPFEDAA